MPSFGALFGSPAAVTKDAPGRVNLIGEHTDYNGGFVLPIATPQRTTVELAPRHDRVVRVWSANVAPGERSMEFLVGHERRTAGWIDYVQGVAFAMRERGWRDRRLRRADRIGFAAWRRAVVERLARNRPRPAH